MAVCTFCHETLFSNPRWLSEQSKPHHDSVLEWRKSLQKSCSICTLLLEHIKTALEQQEKREREDADGRANGTSNPKRARPSPEKPEDNRERDRQIRERTVENALLDWITDEEAKIENLLPIYKVSFYDAGGRNAWSLKFQPRSETIFDGNLSKQNFFVYHVHYDGDKDEPELEDSTDSDTTFAQIHSWIEACKSHTRCQYLHKPPEDSAYVPLRLLDLGESATDPVRLIKTGEKTSRYRPYITLSYKWGYEPLRSAILNDATYVRFTRGLDPSTLPQTFTDAISAARRLGVRYLWIDALCMRQQDAEEWTVESLKMRQVYANAFLSLAATSGDNYQQGLFRRRDPRGVPPSTVRVRWAHHELDCHVIREDFWRGELLSEPLYMRGWVLQERMLAPRMVHFHRRQVVWQCPGLTASERVPGGLSKILDDERRDELRWRQLVNSGEEEYSGAQKADLHGIWRFIVDRYTRCDLTKRQDRLIALAGVAQRMGEAFKEKYFAGLWEKELEEQLAWRVVEFRPRDGDSSYVAPSWAWVSVDGAVHVPARVEHQREYRMQIFPKGVRLMLDKPNKHEGMLLFGSLTAKAQIYRLVFAAASLDQPEWDWVKDTASDGRGSWCHFYPDAPIGWDDLNHTSDLEDDAQLHLPAVADDSKYRLECSAVMLVYQQDHSGRGSESHSGFALALKCSWAGPVKVYSRIGLVEFQGLSGDLWREMYGKRKTKSHAKDEVAPSDDGSDDLHIITLV